MFTMNVNKCLLRSSSKLPISLSEGAAVLHAPTRHVNGCSRLLDATDSQCVRWGKWGSTATSIILPSNEISFACLFCARVQYANVKNACPVHSLELEGINFICVVVTIGTWYQKQEVHHRAERCTYASRTAVKAHEPYYLICSLAVESTIILGLIFRVARVLTCSLWCLRYLHLRGQASAHGKNVPAGAESRKGSGRTSEGTQPKTHRRTKLRTHHVGTVSRRDRLTAGQDTRTVAYATTIKSMAVLLSARMVN